jgi:hypothetical protein
MRDGFGHTNASSASLRRTSPTVPDLHRTDAASIVSPALMARCQVTDGHSRPGIAIVGIDFVGSFAVVAMGLI